MQTRRRKIMAVGVAALLLLGVIGCGVAAPLGAQRGEAGDNVGKGLALGRVGNEVPQGTGLNARIWVIHQGQGFALTTNGFHVLRINIVRVRHFQPLDIRGLLKSNKSIEEIRKEIMEREGTPFYQGYLRLGEDNYRLVNVSVNENGYVRSVDADIVGPLEDPELRETIGNISVIIRDYEGVRVGEGTLMMTENNDYRLEYRVLLNVFPPTSNLWEV